ncbi:MAG: helix-turn-helix domain-containing protein [Kiritimatiellia bacterium]
MSNAMPANLRRLRKLRRLTQEALADAAGISRVAYRSIETGVATPRSGTVEALARALGSDVFALVASAPRAKMVRFRANKVLTAQERADREQLVIETMNWLVDFNELEKRLGERIPAVLPKKSPASIDVAKHAEDVRRKTFKVECRGCLPDVCDVLEQGGVKVRTAKFGMDGLFGFCIGVEDGGPAIAVNVDDGIPVERMIFTAAHELGHLVLHQDSFDPCVEKEDAKQEKEATVFASHFLMPDDQFQEEWSNNRGLHWVDRILKTKRTFRVSWMTVLYRLRDNGDADINTLFKQFQSEYERKTGQELSFVKEPDFTNAPASALRKSQEPARLTEFDFCEDRFERLVRQALEADEISVSRAAEMLGKSVAEVRDLLLDWEAHK